MKKLRPCVEWRSMSKPLISEVNEETEFWKSIRKDQQERRAARLPGRQQEILDLSAHGFSVKQLTEWQFRVDGKIDLYPIHRRYHVLKGGRRGTYRNLLVFLRSVIKCDLS